ncbi:MAG: RusA family crossover junction endodeoxyribonuclease [Firmicutes bacterium]|nr:RusA family crossover junction endodeoxyribonuclease [Bacillota bacterium]
MGAFQAEVRTEPRQFEIRFTVPGRPVPKARHRATLIGGKIVSYTPRKVREFEQAVGWAAKAARVPMLEGPLAVEIHCYVDPRRAIPDSDNLAKSVLDGLNGVAWHDDRQVVDVRCVRHEVNSRGEERTEIWIRPA